MRLIGRLLNSCSTVLDIIWLQNAAMPALRRPLLRRCLENFDLRATDSHEDRDGLFQRMVSKPERAMSTKVGGNEAPRDNAKMRTSFVLLQSLDPLRDAKDTTIRSLLAAPLFQTSLQEEVGREGALLGH